MIFFTFKTPSIARNEKDFSEPLREKLLQMDIFGSLVLMAAVTCLFLALQWGGVTKSWHSADVIGTLIAFGLITVLFVLIEWYQGDRALLVPHLLKKRVVCVGSIVSFLCVAALPKCFSPIELMRHSLGGAEFTLIYYIPIYFQSIQGTNAQESGVRNLAFIIAVSKYFETPSIASLRFIKLTAVAVFTVVSGAAITASGYFTPFVVVGSILMTIGSGLICTFTPTSSAGAWIGYQVLAGIGIGLCFQAPIMGAQALADSQDVSATTAILLFTQTLGGALMVSAAESGFTNKLIGQLAWKAPDVDPSAVIAAGASGLRNAFTQQQLVGVVASYMDGLKVAFIIIAALSGCATVASLAMPWTSIKGKEAAGAV